MRSKLSILGLYNYRPDIFDDFALPEDLDSDQAIDTILMECAELGLTYGDPDIMKQMIGTWSANKLPAWSRILDALVEEYNPLHNYDRHETWSGGGSHNNSTSGTNSGQSSSTDNTTTSGQASASGTNTESVAGFNQASGLATSGKTEQSTSSTSSGTNQQTNSSSNSGTTSGTDTGTYTDSKTGHTYGNIGVTTSAQMLQGEIDVRTANDMYEIICRSFKNQFCIQIY